MKHQFEAISGTIKPLVLPGKERETDAQWDKPQKRPDTPAPPPVWTRYIDSRLKQFCAR